MTKSPRNLLHQPSWAEEPLSPTPAGRKRSERTPRVKIACGPRVGAWFPDLHSYIGQSDEHGEFQTLNPIKPLPPGAPKKYISPFITAHLKEPPDRPKSRRYRPAVSQHLNIPDPTLCTGTQPNMIGMMENLVGDEPPPAQPPFVLSDFVPATDFVDDLDFVEPNSDQESTDIDTGLDLSDFFEFPDDSPDSDRDLEPSGTCTNGDNEGIQGSTEIIAPLMTPASSQSHSPLSTHEGLPKDKTSPGMLGHGMPSSQSRPSLRRSRSGLALTKPIANGSNAPAKKNHRKRKLSESLAQPERHRRMLRHQR